MIDGRRAFVTTYVKRVAQLSGPVAGGGSLRLQMVASGRTPGIAPIVTSWLFVNGSLLVDETGVAMDEEGGCDVRLSGLFDTFAALLRAEVSLAELLTSGDIVAAGDGTGPAGAAARAVTYIDSPALRAAFAFAYTECIEVGIPVAQAMMDEGKVGMGEMLRMADLIGSLDSGEVISELLGRVANVWAARCEP